MGGVVSARTVSPAGVIGKDLIGSGLVNATTYASVNDSINNRLLTAWGDGKKQV